MSEKIYAPRPGHTRTTPLIANICNTLMHNNKSHQVLHNIVYNFFSTCRHALRARTTMADAPAREPAHAARATPPHAHLHVTTASTARFYAVTHGNTKWPASVR